MTHRNRTGSILVRKDLDMEHVLLDLTQKDDEE